MNKALEDLIVSTVIVYYIITRSLEELSGSENRTLVSVLFGQTEPGPPTSKARDGTDLG